MDKEMFENFDKKKMEFLTKMDPMLRDYIIAVASEIASAHSKAIRTVLKLTPKQEEAFERYIDFKAQTLSLAITDTFAGKKP